ncbi:MAG TPA: enhanced serine sensitivity protein SseB C-terminal domain-containing protein [Gemmatimonadaceae bacterium]
MVLDLPRTPPRGPLVEAVRAECKHAADIRAAYFLEASIEAGASHLLLALELSDGAPAQDIARRLMESVKLVLGTSEYIDVMPMAAGSEQSKRVAKLAPPFFNRDSPAR